MISVKCKMCGATNNVEESSSTFICEFCGNEQTKPNIVNNNKLVNLHNRANQCRQSCDFDGAIATYNSIISEDEKDAEAHWGLVLCKYGIEYVDDPKTRKKIPTCHRTLTKSIFDDIDYLDAIKYSDVVSKRLYEKEAEEIDRIQKSIMSLALKEEKYDIFICYKESDEHNNRTKDSVLAQQIYDELTKRKYRVFYARITLEGKLGSQYEPIIYAALYSSKVMLVIGSKKEYFNAVWGKNEWSRFLGMMEEDPSKVIIPCFRDLEAYDLPTELLNYQAQDMNKLGFIQDLTVGIEKIIGSKDKVQESESKETNKYGNLLQRAEMAISDGDFEKADDFLERVLDLNPKEPKAYFYKLLIELKCRSKEELEKYCEKNNINDINSRNVDKILRFGNESDKEYINYLHKIYNDTQIEPKYQKALEFYNKNEFNYAAKYFYELGNYKDSEKLYKDSLQNYEEALERLRLATTMAEKRKKEELYQKALKFYYKGGFNYAAKYFHELGNYKDSEKLYKEALERQNLATIEEEKRKQEKQYQKAVDNLNNGEYIEAYKYFSENLEYKDNKELLEQTRIKILEKTYDILLENEENKEYEDALQTLAAINELTSNEGYKDSKIIEKRINSCLEKIKRRGLRKKFSFIIVTLIIQLLFIFGLFCLSPFIEGYPIGEFISEMFEEYKMWLIFFFTLYLISLLLLFVICKSYFKEGYTKFLYDTMQAFQICWIIFGIIQSILCFEFFEDEDFISLALTPIFNIAYFCICKIIVKVRNIF